MQKCIFVQFSAPNRGFATGMAILRASNVNHRGITLPQFCRTSTAVFFNWIYLTLLADRENMMKEKIG
jgi:hypothetical protein